ncbi:MAG TPA: S41 family peptidase [Thermoanaerobaculia bacterium]|nr:S41 family peptidase [Thermoanaerobaculia bacterium]
MPRHLVLALLLVATLGVAAAPNPAPVNLDFESGSPGEVPPGWISPTTELGYKAALSTETPKEGKQCVRLSGAPIGLPGTVFGNVMQQIDATPYRGKRVRFRGAVRVEGAAATAGLWMRVDRAAKLTGFFENMQARPIRAGGWAHYEINGDVAVDAEVLNVGLILEQEGSAWLDDVTIETLWKTEMRSGPPRAVTARGLENLIAFTRLFGIVRHFHASDEAAAADWDAVAIDGAAAVENAKDASELVSRLGDVFLPLAPSVLIYRSNAPPKGDLAKPSGADTIVAWEHTGLGPKEKAPNIIYSSERVRRSVEQDDPRFPDPLHPLQVDLGGGVSASIPLAVYADASRTLPRPTREELRHSKAGYTGNDRATRIGAVVIAWNALQHFYPYFDVVDVDWPAELRTALRAAGDDRGEAEFLRTLRRMIVSIDDGHGSVSHPSLIRRATLPILWRVVGDALVVTTVDETVTGLSVGDEVVAIDGQPALQALRVAEALVSGATPQWRRWTALRHLNAGEAGTQAALTIRNADGSTRTVTLTRTVRPEALREKRPGKIAELKPGLWYVDLVENLKDADFEASLDKLAAARGIVFDLRGYPRIGDKPLRHLIDGIAESARWNIPILRRPDREGMEWNTGGRWALEPLTPRLPKKIVFLTDGRAISYAESWMGIVEAYKLGEIVGETTAGTNGNINILPLPGGYRVVFTGMKVLKHDGSRHHGVGIAPTVPVSPTLAGIRAGRDEQLERAVEILER